MRLATTRHNGKGRRWWFLCPLLRSGQPCLRRAGKLYLPPLGSYFGCRQCHNLTYSSCQNSRKPDRFARLLAGATGADFDVVNRILKRFGKGL